MPLSGLSGVGYQLQYNRICLGFCAWIGAKMIKPDEFLLRK
jgi:hypothetical protein